MNNLNAVSLGLLLVKWADSFYSECETNDVLHFLNNLLELKVMWNCLPDT